MTFFAAASAASAADRTASLLFFPSSLLARSASFVRFLAAADAFEPASEAWSAAFSAAAVAESTALWAAAPACLISVQHREAEQLPSDAITLPDTKWRSRIFFRASGSFSRPSTVPAAKKAGQQGEMILQFKGSAGKHRVSGAPGADAPRAAQSADAR